MTRITEYTIEDFAFKLFEQLGYEYIYIPNIAHDGENTERNSYEEIPLTHRLGEAVHRINPPYHLVYKKKLFKKFNVSIRQSY